MKTFKLKSLFMNGTVTMSSSENLIFCNNIKEIEKLIKKAKIENDNNNDSCFNMIETVEEIDKFEISIIKNNKIKKINIINILKEIDFNKIEK